MKLTWICTVLVMLVLIGLLGCQRSADPQLELRPLPPADPLAVSAGADLQRSAEVQLVEQTVLHRKNYQKYLELMHQFYDRQGNHRKATWARNELKHLQLGPKHDYLITAEIAGPDLKASTAILDADLHYAEATRLMEAGRGRLGKLQFFRNKEKLYLAIDKFNEVISRYPTSDKIDDAAYQIGQIYQHHLEDPTIALLYYQRVWQWDPQSPLPVRFAVARIYDEDLHDRVTALRYYQDVINLESGYVDNVVHATNRIEQISMELQQP